VKALDVRRLAAIDMYGSRGTRWRSIVIRAEFIAGAVVCPPLGLLVFFTVASTLGWRLFALWLTGVGVNYVPLAVHAVALGRKGALQAELEGADTGRELRYYSLAQFWVAVPLALIVFEAVRLVRKRSRARRDRPQRGDVSGQSRR
jgi:hypothetical protein